MCVPVSFETGFQGDYDVYFPFKSKILRIRSQVIKALANTDAGTITAKNSAGSAMASGVLTHALSAAFGDKQAAVPTTNNTVTADDFARFTVAKTTAGGEALLFIEYKGVQ